MSCWEKQRLGSQQVAWKGRLVPEKMCTPEELCLRGPSRAPGREGLEVDCGHGCAQEPGFVNWVTCSCPLPFPLGSF